MIEVTRRHLQNRKATLDVPDEIANFIPHAPLMFRRLPASRLIFPLIAQV